MLYADLKINDGGGIVHELGLEDLSVYKEKPECCSECKSNKILALEVLGAIDGTLFWISDTCDALHLRYELKKTELWLVVSNMFWTYKNDWPVPPLENFN